MNTPVSTPKPLKHGVSPETRQKVLELRHCHSLSQVAAQTGLPIGTVKTLCARSGAFRDNQAQRDLFSLPAIQQSSSTALVVPELPPQSVVTGDKEVYAVIWLREVIKTGQPDLIGKAMLAAKRIKTPLKELSDRYLKHLVSKNPGNWTVAFDTFGFDDLDGLSKTSITNATRRHEALSRFGSVDNLFAKTPAEEFCIDALHGLKFDTYESKDHAKIDKRFQTHRSMMPHTLSDCLHELAYWSELYWLRSASVQHAGDHWPECQARDDFVFRSLARIRAKSKAEAIAVFRYLADGERMDNDETESILLNLIG